MRARYSARTGDPSVARQGRFQLPQGFPGLGQVVAPAGQFDLDDGQVDVEDAPSRRRRLRREAPRGVQVVGGLVEQAVQDAVGRERGREIAQMGIGRELPQQRVERLAAPVHRQREVVVHQQARGRRPRPGREMVANGFEDVLMLFVPRGRGAVQRRDLRRRDAPQLEAQEVGEQVVVAERGAGGVERGDERVLGFQPLQDRLGSGAARERLGQRAADALEDRRAQQQLAYLWRLAVEHLGEEVARHGPFAAGELGHEAVGIRVRGQRDGRQPHTGRPPLGALLHRLQPTIRHADPVRIEQRAGLVEREAKVGRAQLGELAREPQAVQAERRLLAGREHDPQSCREARDQHLQPCERVVGGELVQVIDHQVQRILEPVELAEESLHDRRALRSAAPG